MAHKKGVGSTDNGRDSKSKRLGIKLFGGQFARAGNIIVRQRGTRFHAGENVYRSKDFSLHAKVDGLVTYQKKRLNRTFVSILPAEFVEEKVARIPRTPAAPEPKSKKSGKPAAEKAAKPAKTAVEETPATPAPAKTAMEKAPAKAKAKTPAKKAEAKVSTEERPKTSKSEKITLPSGKKITADDLKVVEGIGPKIAGLLNEAGILTWADLANADIEKLKGVLADAGSRYRMHDPATWAKQAALAVEAKWEELEAYQDQLKGGKE